jgi:hypothetical protein
MMHSWDSYSWWGPGQFFGLGVFGAFGFLIISILVVVLIALKGYALWHAAKRDEKWWFVVILVINTAGILELCYLIFVVKKWHNHLKGGNINHHGEGHEHHHEHGSEKH